MKKVVLFILVAFVFALPAGACSSAVISGRATPDGRPLLWKHRDTSDLENDVRFFTGEKHNFIGIVNTKDVTGEQVWMGSNSVGFSIMNTYAPNVGKSEVYKGPMDLEGFMMKEVLSHCATVDDFEAMLQQSQGKRGAEANFGVIDASGGAAYFEANPDNYEKFDVSDPKVAPEGYLIRTNFAFSGAHAEGGGYIRYETLEEILMGSAQRGNLTPECLLFEAGRSLKHSLLGHDWAAEELPESATTTQYIPSGDLVVRFKSASSMVVQGVRPGEDPRLTTLWTTPAFQLSSLTLPLWVAAGDPLPDCVVSHDGQLAPLTARALELKKRCFPLPSREGQYYLYLAAVMNRQGDGILQKIQRQDRAMMIESQKQLNQWRETGFQAEQALDYYDHLDHIIEEFYRTQFGLGEE